jgi:uncharacterized protein
MPILKKSTPRLSERKAEDVTVTHTDIDNGTTEGKTRIKPLANIVQGKNNLDSPILIAGFPGTGLVGSISTSYIINKLHMNQIACVESQYIVPGVIYAESKLRHPCRVYANEKGDVCVLVCEAPIIIEGMYSVLDTIAKWILYNKVKEVMVLDGIAVEGLPGSKRIPMILSCDGRHADEANLIHETEENIQGTSKEQEEIAVNTNSGSIYPTTAFVGGMAGGILSSCLSNGIPCKAILIYAARGIPDPEGAAVLIESISKITENKSLKIDTQKLREQGANIRTNVEKIIQSYTSQQEQGQVESPMSSKSGIMYG